MSDYVYITWTWFAKRRSGTALKRWDSGRSTRLRYCRPELCSWSIRSGSKLEEMARAGCVFFGHYDAGAAFDGGYVASDGASFHDVPALWHEARPCVAANSDGSLDQRQLETVAAYYAALAQARSVLGFRD